MSKETDEKVVKEIIEYANNEIKKSKKKHLMILILVLTSIILLSTALFFMFTYERSISYSEDLFDVGISVDKDGRLALDEKAFREKDMTELQDFFEGTNSVLGQLARKASNLAGAAELQATKAASAYTATGSNYTADSMNSGTLFDSLF